MKTIKQILILIIFFPCTFFAQVKPAKNYSVYVNYPEYTVKATVFSKEKKFFPDEHLTYHWYASNKIMKTTGGYDGKLLTGLYSSFYLSGNLKEKGVFKKGLKNKEWVTWYENGKINEVTTWRNGVRNGGYKKLDDEGVILEQSNFKNDKLHGDQIFYTDGKISTKKRYSHGIEITKSNTKSSEKPSFFKIALQKVKILFKKKDKAASPASIEKKEQQKTATKKGNTEKKFKDKLKDKWNVLFKKKEHSTKVPAKTK